VDVTTDSGETYHAWEANAPRKYATVQGAFFDINPFNISPGIQLYNGDDERKEVESFYSVNASPILRRRITLSDEFFSSAELFQKSLSSNIPEEKVLSKASIEYLKRLVKSGIKSNDKPDFNFNQVVGVVNSDVSTSFLEREFSGLHPKGEWVATCGWLYDDAHAEQFFPYLTKILGYTGRRKGGTLAKKEIAKPRLPPLQISPKAEVEEREPIEPMIDFYRP